MAWRLASLLGRNGGDYGTKDIQVLHYGIWPWRRILNGACTSISNLPENIAWQIHRPEARGPLKSGTWGCRPTCHPQTSPLLGVLQQLDTTFRRDPKNEFASIHVTKFLRTVSHTVCVFLLFPVVFSVSPQLSVAVNHFNSHYFWRCILLYPSFVIDIQVQGSNPLTCVFART